MQNLTSCLYAFFACAGFCFIFEVKRVHHIVVASFNGALGWAVYLTMQAAGYDVSCYLTATIVVAFFAEMFARILKSPATIFLLIGIIPLVPGGGVYYAMHNLISGNYAGFANTAMQTAVYAGAIAVGVSVVTAIMRLLFWRPPQLKNR